MTCAIRRQTTKQGALDGDHECITVAYSCRTRARGRTCGASSCTFHWPLILCISPVRSPARQHLKNTNPVLAWCPVACWLSQNNPHAGSAVRVPCSVRQPRVGILLDGRVECSRAHRTRNTISILLIYSVDRWKRTLFEIEFIYM